MNRGTWRDAARPIIAKVIADNHDKTEKEIRRALRKAWPWGQRKRHPYEVWLDEIKRQLKEWRTLQGYASDTPLEGLPMFPKETAPRND